MIRNSRPPNENTGATLVVEMSKSFKAAMQTTKNMVLIDGGRVGGKTKFSILCSLLIMLGQPYVDGIIARANYGSLRDSTYQEMKSAIDDISLLDGQFTFKTSPLRIIRGNNVSNVYFAGYGGSNYSRTKGIKTEHPIGFVIFEETQELKDRQNLEEAIASFRRNYGANVKVFILGNPPPAMAHWFNQYVAEKKKDKDTYYMRATWMDIIPFLNDFDLKEILKTRKNNPEYYNWFYMGEATGGFGSVYPMFLPKKHLVEPSEFNLAMQTSNLKISCVAIGGDGAVNRDATAFVPCLILNNGQSIVGDIFYHNPNENGVIGSHILVQEQLTKWFNMICKKYNLGTMEEYRNNYYGAFQFIPIYMIIDSAATDLIQECRFFFGDRADVRPISKSTIMEMVSSVQSCISNSMLYILNYKSYYNYTKGKEINRDMNILAEQLSLLIWNEKQDKYDPSVPNDVSDALTYAVRFWYQNVENMQNFNILKMNRMKLPLIEDLIRKEN